MPRCRRGKLIDRILKPDLELGQRHAECHLLQRRRLHGPRGYPRPTTKDFAYEQKSAAEVFETREFNTGSFWQANSNFHQDGGDEDGSAAGKIYATKTMEVKDARENGKEYGTREYATRAQEGTGRQIVAGQAR